MLWENGSGWRPGQGGDPARVRRAQSMIAAQRSCTPADALALMINTADAADVTLEQLADEVIARTVSFRQAS